MSDKYSLLICFDRDFSVDLGEVVANSRTLRYWHEVHQAYHELLALAKRMQVYEGVDQLLRLAANNVQSLLNSVVYEGHVPLLNVDIDEEEVVRIGFELFYNEDRLLNKRHTVLKQEPNEGLSIDAITLDASKARFYGAAHVEIPHGELLVWVDFSFRTLVNISDEDWLYADYPAELTISDVADQGDLSPEAVDNLLDEFFGVSLPQTA